MVYATLVDISSPTGPGVNEREFAHAVAESDELDQAVVLLPRPRITLPEVKDRYDFTRPTGKNPFRWLVAQFAFGIALRRRIRRVRPDLVILRLDALPIGVSLGLAGESVPVAIKTQGWGAKEALMRLALIGRAAAWAHRRLTRKLLRRAVAIDTVTEELRKLTAMWYGLNPDRIAVIQNGVNTARFVPRDRYRTRREAGLEAFDPLIGFAGGHPWDRGGAQIVRAVAELVPRFPRLGAIILGPRGTGSQDLSALAHRLGVGAHCSFPGVVDLAEVPSYVASFDVGVSLDRPDRAAVMGNSSQKLRQYIACGVPVIAARGTNAFVAEEGLGSLVDPDDQSEVTNAIRHWLLLSPHDRDRHAERAVTYAASNLSVNTLLSARLALYEERLMQLRQSLAAKE